MNSQLHIGNPGNTVAYLCEHILASMKDGEPPKSLLWTRDEDTCINAMCATCDQTMTEGRVDDVQLGLVAEESLIAVIENYMKEQQN